MIRCLFCKFRILFISFCKSEWFFVQMKISVRQIVNTYCYEMTFSIVFTQNGVTWAAVGHTNNRDPDTGNLNSFGRAFQSAGFVSLTMVTS